MFSLRLLNDVEEEKKYGVEVSNRYAVLNDLDADVEINTDVFRVTRHKCVSVVTDRKLVSETVVPKEIGRVVPGVTGWRRHISTIMHKLTENKW
jgi:hypothetical protein